MDKRELVINEISTGMGGLNEAFRGLVKTIGNTTRQAETLKTRVELVNYVLSADTSLTVEEFDHFFSADLQGVKELIAGMTETINSYTKDLESCVSKMDNRVTVLKEISDNYKQYR